jgi:glutaminyl-peptide cyclotransferase
MMLDLAEALNHLLDKRKQRLEAGIANDEDVADMTLQLVFFDGEEAFVSWTDKDSVYGSRLDTFLKVIREFTNYNL